MPRSSIIKELYDGKLRPYDQVCSGDPLYDSLLDFERTQLGSFTKNLTEDQRADLTTITDAGKEIIQMTRFNSFRYGLRLGVLIMAESVFSDEDMLFDN